MRIDMDRVLLRVHETGQTSTAELSPWDAVQTAKKLLDAAECAQAEADSADVSEKPAAWSSSLFPASQIEVGDLVGGYAVAEIENDGRLTVKLLTPRGSHMTVFFDPTDEVPLEKSR